MSTNTEWQLSGNAVELYEKFPLPTIFMPWAQLLLTNYPPNSGENVLDIACGTGIVARMAKARVGPSGKFVGVDLNSDMLDIARSVTAETTSTIEWIEADVAEIPLGSDNFHSAFCQQGLQLFPDKVGAPRETHRLLRSGGSCTVVVAQSLEDNPLMRSQVKALTKHVECEINTHARHPGIS